LAFGCIVKKFTWILAAWMLITGLEADAQFYAPDTDYHDRAQRLFVVEAARILAWRENLQDPKITEITYTVAADTNEDTTWHVDFLDHQGQVVKAIQASYPTNLLNQGPAFYRNVFQQLWAAGKWTPAARISAVELNDRFWEGADLNGISRETGIQAAFELQTNRSRYSEAVYAPQFAGLLSQVPMPSLCGGVTLDSTLLARGAAWLAFSEAMLPDRKMATDKNWAPILFMAGRENGASALWKASAEAKEVSEHHHALYEWWNFFLSRPKARAAFEFVADARQRRFAMPMMTYYSRLEYLGRPLVTVLPALYGNDPDTLGQLYDYGGFLQASTDVGGGRVLEGAWPAIFREQWLKLLHNLPLDPTDYTGHTNLMLKTWSGRGSSRSTADDASLTGLKEFAPLLELSYEQGTGKINPVATVSARDLLNYGWELNALEMGARYYFVQKVWGVPDLARAIFDAGTRDIEGQMPFFPIAEQRQVFNLQQSRLRLQMVDDLAWRSMEDVNPFCKDLSDTNGAHLFIKRCWLRPYEVRLQAYILGQGCSCDEVFDFLATCHTECGWKSDVLTMEFLEGWQQKELDAWPRLGKLKEQIAEGMVDPCSLQMHALYRKNFAKLSTADRAAAYEKVFWQNPDCGVEQTVVNGYIESGAWKSAKRFYTEARPIFSGDVQFSVLISPQLWMLGFLSHDEELMNLASQNDTGSYSSMMDEVWQAVAHDEPGKAEAMLGEIINRYESDQGPQSQARRMKGFMPLIPALADPHNHRHEEALDYFGKSTDAVFFRWILIQKLKLNAAEATRFLGGRETDRLRRLMILGLENAGEDQLKKSFVDYIESSGNKGAGRAVAAWVLGQPQKCGASLTQEDLKPSDFKTIAQAVWEKTRQN